MQQVDSTAYVPFLYNLVLSFPFFFYNELVFPIQPLMGTSKLINK